MKNIKTYFKDTDVFIEGNKYLRYPQKKAYLELKNSFKNNTNIHKIVVLATGAGKTGLIALTPFGISEGRVLVITPSLIIREGISDEFDTRTDFNFWSRRKVILDDNNLPTVYRYAGFSNSASDKKRVLKYLTDANIVIANIHKVYNKKSQKPLTSLLDKDFFDMIIIDEAHHSAADSWVKTLEYFNAKKIVKLTATPYRADEKELGGEIIYTYDLADAIKDGIVKNIVAQDYTNEELKFEVDGKLVDKEIALKKMDNNWLSRSIAYSYDCSKTIVDMSINRLNEKRRLGKAHHQIIAVACGIEHAKQIKKMYEECGLKAEYVSSNRPDESENAIIEFKKGQIDVIVNVDMLAEGFDHPNISIAAIFRPFRTLSPYAQFIGRSLRKIQGEDINDTIDNIAHVIYHKELGLEELWEYYSGQVEKSERKKIIQLEQIREEYNERNIDIGKVSSAGEIFLNEKTFLQDNVNEKYSNEIYSVIKERQQQIQEYVENMRKLPDITEEDIKILKEVKIKQLDKEITNKREKLREELIREELHKHHTQDIINQVINLYDKTKLQPKGTELPENSSAKYLKDSKYNDAYIMKYINNSLKRKLKRGIDEWETYDYENARKLIPEIIKMLEGKIERIRGVAGK